MERSPITHITVTNALFSILILPANGEAKLITLRFMKLTYFDEPYLAIIQSYVATITSRSSPSALPLADEIFVFTSSSRLLQISATSFHLSTLGAVLPVGSHVTVVEKLPANSKAFLLMVSIVVGVNAILSQCPLSEPLLATSLIVLMP